jgi:ferredoxin
MGERDAITFACSCEDTMVLDAAALKAGAPGELRMARHLCRREISRFDAALGENRPIVVGCTQEAPLFTEHAEAAGAADRITYANIRENAGWSNEGAGSGPKMAALLAAAAEPMPAIPFLSLTSEGVVLVYGRDDIAIEAARRLAEHLDVTVLLAKPQNVVPPRQTEFPVLKGTIARASGHLGAYELGIDDFAQPSPSSRGVLRFEAGRNGATSRCDLILDLSGGAPLFPAHELRPGYLRADPGNTTAVAEAIMAASHLVGTFDKPRYIAFTASLCAHSRSSKTGCVRCLDLCPTGAITPDKEHVSIDPALCAGCGACASVCPTGAAAYALPPADALVRRLRRLVQTYRGAGGANPVILFHDGDHGEPLIEALARHGDGLPANVLPLRVNEVTQIGPEALAAAFAYGATGARLLLRAKPKHDVLGLARLGDLMNRALEGYGYGQNLVSTIETDDPDALASALAGFVPGTPPPKPASFLSGGAKRGLLELSFRELYEAAPAPVPTVALGAGAPFGGLAFDTDNCTLCLACVSACPVSALSDNPERPSLRFTESLCVQCGLCAATCPEKVITLEPRLNIEAWDAPRRIVKEEEPFHCISCAKPFGVRSSIERVTAKLSGQHWMFSGPEGSQRLRLLMMCEDCRVEAVVNEGLDPHAAPQRPRARTTEDYLRERASGKDDLS